MFLDILHSFPIIDRTVGLYRVYECSPVLTDINRRMIWVTIIDRHQGISEAGRANLPTHCGFRDLVRCGNLSKTKRSFAVLNYALREIVVNSNEVDRMPHQLEVS